MLRFMRGEDVLEVLPRFCEENKIHAAALYGIGAVKGITFGYLDGDSMKFVLTKNDELLELLNMTGNVALVEGKPKIHMHATLSDRSNKAFGGHVTSVIVGVAIEAHLVLHDIEAEKKPDDFSGLNILSLKNTYA